MRRGRGSSSKKIGTRVHREVECWIKGLEQPNKRLHRYTIQIQKSFTALKLEPIASEFPVISVDGAYLTHIDVLCKATRIDGKAELVLVSLKTGYSRGALNYKNNCKAPCQSIPNSQQNHHILQLACERYVLDKEYGIKVGRAMIIYAGYGKNREARVLNLPMWAKQPQFLSQLHSALRMGAIRKQQVLPETFIDRLEDE